MTTNDRLTAPRRGTRMPIVLGIPFGLTIETIPTHLPLPAKIRTELLMHDFGAALVRPRGV